MAHALCTASEPPVYFDGVINGMPNGQWPSEAVMTPWFVVHVAKPRI
jgi:hypothetical protein